MIITCTMHFVCEKKTYTWQTLSLKFFFWGWQTNIDVTCDVVCLVMELNLALNALLILIFCFSIFGLLLIFLFACSYLVSFFIVVYSVLTHPFWGQTRSSVKTCLIFIEFRTIQGFFHYFIFTSFIVSVYWDIVASLTIHIRQAGLTRLHFRLLNGSQWAHQTPTAYNMYIMCIIDYRIFVRLSKTHLTKITYTKYKQWLNVIKNSTEPNRNETNWIR